MTYKTTTNLKEFDLTGMNLDSLREFTNRFDIRYELYFSVVDLPSQYGQLKPLRVYYVNGEVTKFSWL